MDDAGGDLGLTSPYEFGRDRVSDVHFPSWLRRTRGLGVMRQPRVWGSGKSPLKGRVAGLDVGLFVVLTLFGTLGATNKHAVSLVAGLTAVAFVMPLLWRRSAPLTAIAAFPFGVAVNAFFAYRGVRCGAAIPTVLLLLYSAGAHLDRRRALLGLTLGLAGIAIEDLTDPRLNSATLIGLLPLCAAVWSAGRMVRSRTAVAGELRRQTHMLEVQREQTAQLAVEVERQRIGADLDQVARGRVGEIVELARRGEAATASGLGGAEATFRGIERRSRETLDQIRGLLGVLRGDEAASQRQPQPSLTELEDLFERARQGGRLVRFEVEGRRRALPASVELSAYRILQATFQAMDRRAEVSVRLDYGDDVLELEVSGCCDSIADQEASVIAVRERALLHGGTLAITSAGSGRHAFHARLPLAA